MTARTPWAVSPGPGPSTWIHEDDAFRRRIAKVYRKSDARSIVRASNAHDDLLAAAEATVNSELWDDASPEWGNTYQRIIGALRAAIAKAKA